VACFTLLLVTTFCLLLGYDSPLQLLVSMLTAGPVSVGPLAVGPLPAGPLPVALLGLALLLLFAQLQP
jgi:hypothetical protein